MDKNNKDKSQRKVTYKRRGRRPPQPKSPSSMGRSENASCADKKNTGTTKRVDNAYPRNASNAHKLTTSDREAPGPSRDSGNNNDKKTSSPGLEVANPEQNTTRRPNQRGSARCSCRSRNATSPIYNASGRFGNRIVLSSSLQALLRRRDDDGRMLGAHSKRDDLSDVLAVTRESEMGPMVSQDVIRHYVGSCEIPNFMDFYPIGIYPNWSSVFAYLRIQHCCQAIHFGREMSRMSHILRLAEPRFQEHRPQMTQEDSMLSLRQLAAGRWPLDDESSDVESSDSEDSSEPEAQGQAEPVTSPIEHPAPPPSGSIRGSFRSGSVRFRFFRRFTPNLPSTPEVQQTNQITTRDQATQTVYADIGLKIRAAEARSRSMFCFDLPGNVAGGSNTPFLRYQRNPVPLRTTRVEHDPRSAGPNHGYIAHGRRNYSSTSDQRYRRPQQ